MIRCEYNDCGWCYAPDEVCTNDNSGQCNNMRECEQSIEIKEIE